MKKKWLANTAVILIALIPVVYLTAIWKTIPEIVPMHFGADMKPDRMGNKAELWFPVGLMAGVSLFVYFLLKNLHRIDPKRKDIATSGTFTKMGFGLVVFLAALNILIIMSANGSKIFESFLFPLLGLLFAFIGNYMLHIKPNYFAGLRLPWTLSSDENWRRTHLLAGKLWFAGGLLFAVASLFLPTRIGVPLLIGTAAILVLIPTIYSYRLFKTGV